MPDSKKNFTEHLLANEDIEFPNVAAGGAVKTAARRMTKSYGIPEGAAFAFAAATQDPTEERNKVGAKDPMEHLTMVQTPSGKLLACHAARLWTTAVSGDGGNGRSRYGIQTSKDSTGHKVRPWPIGRHHKPAIIDYHPHSLDDMVAAVRMSAEQIKSPDLITQIGRNPRGIWNPPVVVLARTFVSVDDGSDEEHWFLHTIEGSTRVEACHEMIGTDPGDPLLRADDPLGHVRDSHERLIDLFGELPTSPKALAAARAATMPALVVFAVVDSEGNPIDDGFPDVVNDYVESVHVQPRPFNEVAQSNVLGERFLLTLRREGRMPEDDVDDLLGRGKVSGRASVRAAELIRAVCDAGNEAYIRDIVITEDRARLTKSRRSGLVGPLIVRQFEKPAETADRSLMRPFMPDVLIDTEWSIGGDDWESLRDRALADFDADETDTPALLELMARGVASLCASGLVLSDQGSTVKGISDLRGNVDKVVVSLMRSKGGLSLLADAVGWADGDRRGLPRMFDPDGTVLTYTVGNDTDDRHYTTSWEKGNLKVRALAFTKGIVPTGDEAKADDGEGEEPTPEQRYDGYEEALLESLIRADTHFGDLIALKDEQDRHLVKTRRMRSEPVYREFPEKLTRVYSKFGKDDFLRDLDEDLMPDEPPTLNPSDEAEEE